jgi:hypothetical protein
MGSRAPLGQQSVDVELRRVLATTSDHSAKDSFTPFLSELLGLEDQLDKVGDRDLAAPLASQNRRDVAGVEPTLERGRADSEDLSSLRGADRAAEGRLEALANRSHVVLHLSGRRAFSLCQLENALDGV